MKTIIFFILTAVLTISLIGIVACQNKTKDNDSSETTDYKTGNIIGYTKCGDVLGFIIITEPKDSLLSFNIPPSSIGLEGASLVPGAYNLDNISISFKYRNSTADEIKGVHEFLCPQQAMLPGFTYGNMELYAQIIITNITIKGFS
jgi:hypothetical protein